MGSPKKDYIENFGKVPMSPWMSGEQAHHTSAVIQGASKITEIEKPTGDTWDEPDVKLPTRSMNTVVFQAKNGGNSVVINDEGTDGDGYMLITHNSGTVVQIDENGTVLIKSFGDFYNTSEGLIHQRSAGDTNLNVGDDYNIMVEGGSNNVYVKGDVNVECENYNITARGKAMINAGEGIFLKGARISGEAHTDDIDLTARNVKITSAQTTSLNSLLGTYISTVGGSTHIYSSVNTNMTSVVNTTINATGNFTAFGGATASVHSTGAAFLDGTLVNLGMGNNGQASNSLNIGIPGSIATPKQLSDPPGRTMSVDGKNGISTVTRTPDNASGRQIDGE